MTCKDCIHFESCERMISSTSEMFKVILSEVLKKNCDIKYDSTYILLGAEFCQCFQDRSRFVELPCKIGDIVYFGYYLPTIKQYKIDEWIVAKISFVDYHLGYFFDSDGKWAVGDKENRIAITLVLSDKSEFSPDSIDVPLKDFRDMFFPSREAAEQALKEREKCIF